MSVPRSLTQSAIGLQASHPFTEYDGPYGKLLLFYTEYHLELLAVTELTVKIENSLKEAELECLLEHDQKLELFRVRCIPVDWKQVTQILQRCIKNYIEKETSLPKKKDESKPDKEYDDHDIESFDQDIRNVFDPYATIPSLKIKQLSTWKKEHQYKKAPDLDTDSESEIIVQRPQDAISYISAEFNKLAFKDTWSCAVDKDNLDNVITDTELTELMELTGCQLFKSSDHTKIFIGSHGEQNCHLAISKLDVLRKYYTPRNSIFVAHIFYNGDNENAKLCLKLFKTIGSRYLKSTILDNLHVLRNTPLSNFLNLHEAISVRAAPYIQSRSGFVPLQENYHQQSIEMIDPEQGLKDWAEFRYQAKGDHAACPTNHLPEPLPVDAALMVEPLSENSQTQQDDPLHTGDSSIKKWQQNIPKYGTRQVNEPRSSWTTPTKRPGWDTYGAVPERAVVQEACSHWTARPPPQLALCLVSNINAMPRSSSMTIPLARLVSPASSNVVNRSSSGITTGLLQIASLPHLSVATNGTPHLLPTVTHQNPVAPHLRTATEVLAMPRSASQPLPALDTFDLLSSDVPELSSLGAPTSINIPIDQSPPDLHELDELLNLYKTDNSPVAAGHNLHGLGEMLNLDTPPVCLLDGAVSENYVLTPPLLPDQPPSSDESQQANESQQASESQQANDEITTRTYHNTMTLLAPKRNPYAGRLEAPSFAPKKPAKMSSQATSSRRAEDPSAEFIEEFKSNFDRMMKGLRGYRGALTIEAQFGRIMLRYFNSSRLTDKDCEKVYDADYLRKMLFSPTAKGPTCYFTPVLTTIPGDVRHVLATVDVAGSSLWDERGPKWKVIYEFSFRSGTGHRFTVQIDAESFSTKIKSPRELANIYIHGTHRYNDIRVMAAGCDSSDDCKLQDAYGDLARALESSLWIKSGANEPCLYWTLSSDMAKYFELEDVTVRRELRYKGKEKDNKSILKVTEMIALDPNVKKNNTIWIYRAAQGPRDRMPYCKLNTWYEVSIICPELDDLLEDNKTLELGQEPRWTEDVLADIRAAGKLYSPALQMLKQLDAVGACNHNGVPFSKLTEIQTARQPVVGEDLFW